MSYKKIPIEGYTHVYKHEYTTLDSRHNIEYKNGIVCETLEELNNATWGRFEYDCTTHKHLGVAKIKIELLED